MRFLPAVTNNRSRVLVIGKMVGCGKERCRGGESEHAVCTFYSGEARDGGLSGSTR